MGVCRCGGCEGEDAAGDKVIAHFGRSASSIVKLGALGWSLMGQCACYPVPEKARSWDSRSAIRLALAVQ
jgi:hypothetical protein